MKPLYTRIKVSMFIVLTVALLLSLSSCVSYPTVTQNSVTDRETTGETSKETVKKETTSQNSAANKDTTKSTSFTNKYGTPTTKCAHSGCDNYIASSGDTNCCTKHSHKCLECGKYIDEDATWCMDCIKNALSTEKESSTSKTGSNSGSKSGSSKGPWHSSRVSNDGMGPYYCLGKNDTCNNKTYNCHDKYCDSCDPDGDNIEG